MALARHAAHGGPGRADRVCHSSRRWHWISCARRQLEQERDAVRGLVNAINNSGINTAKAILWHQGERDARNSVDQAAYQTALSEMLDDLQGDLGGNFADLRLVCAQIGMSRLLDARQLDRVRLAQANRWDNDPDILAGPVLHDVDLSDGGGDGVHFRTDAELQTLTDRWWRALK